MKATCIKNNPELILVLLLVPNVSKLMNCCWSNNRCSSAAILPLQLVELPTKTCNNISDLVVIKKIHY